MNASKDVFVAVLASDKQTEQKDTTKVNTNNNDKDFLFTYDFLYKFAEKKLKND